MRLTLRQLGVYLGHIPVIMAREAITQSMVASMPYLDEDDRASVLNDWSRVAGTKSPTAAEPISFEEFKQDIKRRVQ